MRNRPLDPPSPTPRCHSHRHHHPASGECGGNGQRRGMTYPAEALHDMNGTMPPTLRPTGRPTTIRRVTDERPTTRWRQILNDRGTSYRPGSPSPDERLTAACLVVAFGVPSPTTDPTRQERFSAFHDHDLPWICGGSKPFFPRLMTAVLFTYSPGCDEFQWRMDMD